MSESANKRSNMLLLVMLGGFLGFGLGAVVFTQCADTFMAPRSEREEVTRFVEQYFELWKLATIEDYAALFSDGAVIQFIGTDGRARNQFKPEFIQEQTQYLREHPKAREEPKRILVWMETPESAQAYVTWDLMKPGGKEQGVDLFTLIKVSGRWQIVHLTFYRMAH